MHNNGLFLKGVFYDDTSIASDS